jgi:hypothetical protein
VEDRPPNSRETDVTWRSNELVHPLAQMGHCIDCFFAACSTFGGTFEEWEILSPSHDHHLPVMSHSSLPPSEHVHEKPQPMPQSSPPPNKHVLEMSQPSPPHKEQGPPSEHVPPEEVHAQEGARKEPEIWQQIPITIRPIYTPRKKHRINV